MIKPEDAIVEIGPGRGALTAHLVKRCQRLDVIELDRDLVDYLGTQHPANEHMHIHSADALRFDFRALSLQAAQPLRVIGNLPYNISTPLIFHLLAQADAIKDMLFMLQKEVVDRMAAGPGSKDYGRLSVMVQQACQVERLFLIRPGAFLPPPKVDSAIVTLKPGQNPAYRLHEPALFARIVQQAFGQRRKTLRNSLRDCATAETIQAAGLSPKQRAEELSVADFCRLANYQAGLAASY